MAIKPIKNQFNAGQISPLLAARFDMAKHAYSAKQSLNFIPLVEGALMRRGGSHFVAPAKEVDAVLFKIIPTPDDARVFINNMQNDQLYCAVGDVITYSVSLEGYQTIKDKIIMTDNLTLNIDLLSQKFKNTLTIETTPEEATVYINNIETKEAVVLKNSVANYVVEYEGYDSVKSSVQVDIDLTIEVGLVMSFSVMTDIDGCDITINGQSINKIEVAIGNVVSWSVVKAGYDTQSGTVTIDGAKIQYVTMKKSQINDVVFEKGNAGTYSVNLKSGYYNLSICGAGGGGGASAGAHAWYGSNGGSGAAFAGKVYLPAGTYEIKVGLGGSGGKASGRNAKNGAYVGSNYLQLGTSWLSGNGFSLVCFAGFGGNGTGDYANTGIGRGGLINIVDPSSYIKASTIKQNGVDCSAQSILKNGYGAGGKAGGLAQEGAGGTNGYAKLVYVGQV